MANISYYNFRFPDTEDFTGAVTAILRLQDTYRLSPSLITSGKLGTTTTLPMTCEDDIQLHLRVAYFCMYDVIIRAVSNPFH